MSSINTNDCTLLPIKYLAGLYPVVKTLCNALAQLKTNGVDFTSVVLPSSADITALQTFADENAALLVVTEGFASETSAQLATDEASLLA
jgi:hypothetical protein